jgi:hypothetical protein
MLKEIVFTSMSLIFFPFFECHGQGLHIDKGIDAENLLLIAIRSIYFEI